MTIGGGIATVLTWGAATPLLVTGLGIGLAGAGTSLVSSFVEASINSTEIKKAEKDLKEALDGINDVNNTIQLWLDRKEKARVLYICVVAIRNFELSAPVVRLLQNVVLRALDISPNILNQVAAQGANAGAQGARQAGAQGARQAGAQGARQAGAQGARQAGAQGARQAGAQGARQAGAQGARQAGAQVARQAGGEVAGDVARVGARAGGKLIVGVGAVFLVWDAPDLTFTIKDLVDNKGSEAAKFLKEKADELEQVN